MQGGLHGALYNLSDDLAGLALFHASCRQFAHAAPTGIELLARMLVAFFAADMGFVHFDCTRNAAVAAAEKGFTDLVRQMPCALLPNAHIPVQLHAGRTFEVGGQLEYGDSSCPMAEPGRFHDRSGLGTVSDSIITEESNKPISIDSPSAI